MNLLTKLKKMRGEDLINEKVTEKEFINFITVCKNIPPITFFWVIFCAFFQQI
jgi:hypothetical protein